LEVFVERSQDFATHSEQLPAPSSPAAGGPLHGIRSEQLFMLRACYSLDTRRIDMAERRASRAQRRRNTLVIADARVQYANNPSSVRDARGTWMN
jgi:hypothetical protein